MDTSGQRIGILSGAIVAITLILVDPRLPLTRSLLLGFLFLSSALVVIDLDWVKKRQTYLSLFTKQEDLNRRSTLRVVSVVLAAAAMIAAIGVVTWPSKEREIPATKPISTTSTRADGRELAVNTDQDTKATPLVAPSLPKSLVFKNKIAEPLAIKRMPESPPSNTNETSTGNTDLRRSAISLTSDLGAFIESRRQIEPKPEDYKFDKSHEYQERHDEFQKHFEDAYNIKFADRVLQVTQQLQIKGVLTNDQASQCRNSVGTTLGLAECSNILMHAAQSLK